MFYISINYSYLKNLIILNPAIIPSFTALEIWNVPPIQSPQAYIPLMFVSIFSLTFILLFSNTNPIFLAISILSAVPCAINIPFTFISVPSSNSIFSTFSCPNISFIVLLFISTFSLLISGAGFPFVNIVILFTIDNKSFTSDIA